MRYKARKQTIFAMKREGMTTKERMQLVEEENKKLKSILESTLHEVRQFSAIISDRSHALSHSEILSPRANDLSETIFFASGMLSARLGYTEIEINPSVVSRQVRYGAVIYKKFHKSMYLLRPEMSYNKVKIDFRGESHMETAILSVFDMLPFVILQNAVKYSPPGYHVDVDFDQRNANCLEVTVSSYGPLVDDDEVDKLFLREFRGRHSTTHEGQGLGLHLAKKVCDLHNTSISISTGELLSHSIGGKRFQKFIVLLRFDRLDWT